MNIFFNILFLFAFSFKLYCLDKEPNTLQKLPTQTDSLIDLPITTTLPIELRLIIANYSDNLKVKYCLFTTEEREQEKSVYYTSVLKKYLEKITLNAATQSIKREEYEKNIFESKEKFASSNFIFALNNYYKKYIVQRTINFKKYNPNFVEELILSSNQCYLLFDIIEDKNKQPLLCECINNQGNRKNYIYSIDFIKFAIQNGVNINVKAEGDYTPLHLCALRNNITIAQLLIQKGADINSETIYKNSPLHVAAINNNIEMINLLIENGAKTNQKNNKMETQLDLAIRSHHLVLQNSSSLPNEKIDIENNNNFNDDLPFDFDNFHLKAGIKTSSIDDLHF